jgi:hypothetical protein
MLTYLMLLAVSAGLAWYLWGFPSVRRLDERVMGERGIAIVTTATAVLLVVATIVTLAQHVWGVAIAYGLMSSWVGYWSYRRLTRRRTTTP